MAMAQIWSALLVHLALTAAAGAAAIETAVPPQDKTPEAEQLTLKRTIPQVRRRHCMRAALLALCMQLAHVAALQQAHPGPLTSHTYLSQRKRTEMVRRASRTVCRRCGRALALSRARCQIPPRLPRRPRAWSTLRSPASCPPAKRRRCCAPSMPRSCGS